MIEYRGEQEVQTDTLRGTKGPRTMLVCTMHVYESPIP